jgi:hypothetical protein
VDQSYTSAGEDWIVEECALDTLAGVRVMSSEDWLSLVFECIVDVL